MAEPENESVLPLAAEVLEVGKRSELTGRVRVNTSTEEVQQLIPVSLDSEAVDVTRVPVNREISAVPTIRTEGDLTIVPIVEERVVVEKRLVLVEELQLRRSTKTVTAEVPVTLRKQHASIERQTFAAKPTEEESK